MSNKYELVEMEYPITTNPDNELSLLSLSLEFIANQSKCSFELKSNDCQLKRKERQKLKQLIVTFQSTLEEKQSADLSDLSKELKKLQEILLQEYPETNDIALHTIRIVGSYMPYFNEQLDHKYWTTIYPKQR